MRAHTLTISPRLYLSLNQPIVNGTEEEEEEDDEKAQQPDASAVADEEETAEPQPPSKNKGKKGDKKKKDMKKGGKNAAAAADGGGGGSGEMDPAFAFDAADDGVSALSRVLAGLVGWFHGLSVPYPTPHGRHLERARACAQSFILTDPTSHHTPHPTVRREDLVGLPLRPR